jgi:hypothetical protein
MFKRLFFIKFIFLALFSNHLFAQSDIDQVPPDDAKKITHVIDFLEKKGIEHVLNIQFDDWIWKASALKGNKKSIYYMSPKSLVIFKKKHEYDMDPIPPSNGKSIRDIIKLVENVGYRNIRQVSFENLVWKVKTYNKTEKEKKFIIEPITGSILYKNASLKRSKPYDVYNLAKN